MLYHFHTKHDKGLRKYQRQKTKTITYNMNQIIQGDAMTILKTVESETIDLVYLDPPFFTQRRHKLKNRQNKLYEFDDNWNSLTEYKHFIKKVLVECQRVLKSTGSIFFHCDKSASHHIRLLLDKVFGAEHFQSEIIWTYRRWSNTKKGLLNAHQNIYFYSKSLDYTFNPIYTNYSPATNLDQILQDRVRNNDGKATYKLNKNNETVLSKAKKGVPLSDVWDIPLLNPKAKERVGYPTQKPVLLVQRIVEVATQKGQMVLDPMCGSGTTGVAAQSLQRQFIGIDISEQAVQLARKRLKEMVISSSKILENGKVAFVNKSNIENAILQSIHAFPVQRNRGIDGFLKDFVNEKPVPVKIQKPNETLKTAFDKLLKATWHSRYEIKILIQTKEEKEIPTHPLVLIIKCLDLLIQSQFQD